MSELLPIAIKAAIDAGEIILQVYNSDFSIERKEDSSPLTIADKKANDIIVTQLKKHAFPIISEENKQLPFSERQTWNQCWIVDPLDGTKEFIKRNGEFTVNIALVEKGVPKLGVIYVPVTKVLYFTDVGSDKSYKVEIKTLDEEVNAIIKRADSIQPKKSHTPTRIVGSRSHLNEETQAFVDEMAAEKQVEMVSIGSSLKFCLVAEGAADVYPRFAPTMEWDTAAGQAICEAVGISVMALPQNEPLRYNKENLLNPHFIVTIPS